MSKYEVGDELRIREWDDMEAEFGLDEDGDIDISVSFMSDMRYLCGRDFTVSKVHVCHDTFRYYSFEKTEEDEQGLWIITEEMLELRTEEDLYAASDDELIYLLNI